MTMAVLTLVSAENMGTVTTAFASSHASLVDVPAVGLPIKDKKLPVTISTAWKEENDVLRETVSKILAMCSVGSGATNQNQNQNQEGRRFVFGGSSPTMANVMLGDENVRGVESSGSLCKALRQIELVTPKEFLKGQRPLIVLGQVTKAVPRGRRLGVCNLKDSDDPSLASTGGWNVLSESCVLGSRIDVNSGKTMKVKKNPLVSGPVVIDRQATSGSFNRHFYVNGGNLEMEGVTLTGGYAVSLFFCCIFFSFFMSGCIYVVLRFLECGRIWCGIIV